jgi:hypothetical protein
MNEPYTQTICIIFCVLILKVVTIYYEPSLVIILKEFKCICMSYIITNDAPPHSLKDSNVSLKLKTMEERVGVCSLTRYTLG